MKSPELSDQEFAVLPLGVDTEHFSPAPKSIELGDPALLYVGRVVEWKGVHTLIDATKSIKKIFPKVKLNIVGPEPDSGYSARLRKQIKGAEIGDAVVFHGVQPYEQLPAWYQSADLFLLASRQEGFGMVVIESLACGTPVVALDVPGGPREIITNGVDGILAREEEFHKHVLELVSDRQRLCDMSSAARQTAVAKYSTRVTTDMLREIIVKATGR